MALVGNVFAYYPTQFVGSRGAPAQASYGC